jgi:hypothetical protein
MTERLKELLSDLFDLPDVSSEQAAEATKQLMERAKQGEPEALVAVEEVLGFAALSQDAAFTRQFICHVARNGPCLRPPSGGATVPRSRDGEEDPRIFLQEETEVTEGEGRR